jgi:hypothetical protein
MVFGAKSPPLKPCKTTFSAEVGQAVLVSRKLEVSKQLYWMKNEKIEIFWGTLKENINNL